ncbi:hypothetical protein FDECE_8393 [Fusarium decemcellulare]|nr:hypothetical protein FDECE_8393 [Fusarium decemcellulare]
MKFTTIFSLATAVITVNAKCYGSGEEFNDKAAAYEWANKLCYGYKYTQDGIEYTVGPKLAGTYGAQSTVSGSKSNCVDSHGQKLEFFIDHIKGGERVLEGDECYDGLQKEIGCKHGGKSEYTNWKYKVDPNAGTC